MSRIFRFFVVLTLVLFCAPPAGAAETGPADPAASIRADPGSTLDLGDFNAIRAFTAFYLRNGSSYPDVEAAFQGFLDDPAVDGKYKAAAKRDRARILAALDQTREQFNSLRAAVPQAVERMTKDMQDGEAVLDAAKKDWAESASSLGKNVDDFLESMYAAPKTGAQQAPAAAQ